MIPCPRKIVSKSLSQSLTLCLTRSPMLSLDGTVFCPPMSLASVAVDSFSLGLSSSWLVGATTSALIVIEENVKAK